MKNYFFGGNVVDDANFKSHIINITSDIFAFNKRLTVKSI